jgi:histidyl-tRNA synthetase
MGIERLLLSMENQTIAEHSKKRIEIIPLDDKTKTSAFQIGQVLRSSVPQCVVNVQFESKSLKAALRQADKNQTALVCILGEDELSKNEITVKNLQTGKQQSVSADQIVKFILDATASPKLNKDNI